MNNDTFYNELEELVQDAFDQAFGRKLNPKKKNMDTELEFANDNELPRNLQETYNVIKQAQEPVGRKYILENVDPTVVSDTNWISTIKDLKDLGLVEQTGSKRGTKYTAN